MSLKYQRLIVLVVLIAALAVYIDVADSFQLGEIKREFTTQLGLDLVGGAQALLEADLPAETAIDADAMNTAANIVENRVNGLGVTEAVVQRAGERRVVVELPGESDPERVLATLQQTGLLEFVDFSGESPATIQLLESTGQKIQTDFGLTEPSTSQPEPTVTPTVEATPVLTPSESLTSTQPVTPTQPVKIYHTIMTGADLKTVNVNTNQQTGAYVVSFELTADGTKIFKDYTTTHVGEILAIVLDKQIISAPTIQEPITDGSGQISGSFTYETANALAINLRYGSLPIPLKVVEIRTVGPTLGQDSLRKSLIAGLIGFSIIVLFMFLYYRLPGIVADIGIVIYALVAFAIFRFIPITLTLPGIAGFLLSTGSALDANILIFERMKEELRAGRPLGQAVALGWKRAWPSIRDSNLATLITCGILFWFGSTFGATIVKGFSVTLALGVGVSLMTAFLVTRTLLEVVLYFYKSTNFAKWFGI